jgi:hypothetical protein
MNKFEKLIEYVINDEDGKASDLFHEIVVDKSRQIYEDLMKMEMGGDPVDELINDVEADEEGIDYEDDMDMGDDDMDYDDDGETDEHEEGHEELEDRVVDLEDKLDELMAEFDELIGGEEMGDEMPMDDEMMDMGDEMPMDDMEPEFEEGMYESKEVDEDEEVTEEEDCDDDDDKKELDENVALSNVTKPNNSESEGTNKSSANADNAGAKSQKGTVKPVAMGNKGENKGRSNPTAKDMGSTTKPNEKKVAMPKAKGEDSGTNKKSITGS